MIARVLFLLLCSSPALAQAPSVAGDEKLSAHEREFVTWRGEIAPILYKNCLSCHHTGGSGPFDLSSYAQAKRWSPQILDVTQTRYMPPWLPAPGHGDFAGNRRMTDSDVAAIKAWVTAGSPEGTGKIPIAPAYKSSWELGPPDLVLEMATAMQVPASGTDLYRNFVLTVPAFAFQGKQPRWIRAMQIQPGSAQVTHHANVILDRTDSLRRQHPADWQRGVPGMDILVDSGDDFDPDSHFLFWKPDSTALVEPPGMPWRLDPGDDLILNMHLKPTGKPETVRAKIGLYFTDMPAVQHPMLLQLENDAALDIPAGDKSFDVTDELTLPVALNVLGVYPHAHYLGKRLEGWATLPDGSRRDLVLIENWDIDRQSVYRLAKPLALPAGTVVHMCYSYDNSAENPHNPHSPPVRVRSGNRSEDEMAHLWLQVLPANPKEGDPDPRLALERAWMENRLRKSPNDDIALYNLAALESSEGRNPQAEAIYRHLLTLRPNDARTLTSLGAALATDGDWQGAQQHFRAAIAADADYTDAAFDLASLDLEHDNATEAQPLLESLTTKHPADATAQRLLAILYANQGLLTKALDRLKQWQSIEPTNPDPHRALAQVYAQMGQQTDAIREQKAVLALAPKSASDWSDLGVLEAQGGNRIAARKDFEHALELDPALEAAQANLSKLQ